MKTTTKMLELELHRCKMRLAAELYTDFLKKHPEELKLIEEWESAALCDDSIYAGKEE